MTAVYILATLAVILGLAVWDRTYRRRYQATRTADDHYDDVARVLPEVAREP